MTKAEKIRDLLKLDLTNKEIAFHVGCSDAYVRATKQRMIGGGMTEADRRHQQEPRLKRAVAARARALYHARKNGLPRADVLAAGRAAYAAVR